MEEAIKEQAEKLIQVILESDVYQSYKIQKEKIANMPELKSQIDEYRRKRFELQNIDDESLLFDKMEEFDRQYQKFEEDPIVEAFLAAELDFCRDMQEMYNTLTAALEFD